VRFMISILRSFEYVGRADLGRQRAPAADQQWKKTAIIPCPRGMQQERGHNQSQRFKLPPFSGQVVDNQASTAHTWRLHH